MWPASDMRSRYANLDSRRRFRRFKLQLEVCRSRIPAFTTLRTGEFRRAFGLAARWWSVFHDCNEGVERGRQKETILRRGSAIGKLRSDRWDSGSLQSW